MSAIIICVITRTKTQEVVIRGMIVNVITKKGAMSQTISLVYQINNRLLKLLDNLRRKYMIGATTDECNGDKCDVVKNTPEYVFVDHILRDFNYEVIHEHRPSQKGKNVAYSWAKGKLIMLCLRDIDNPAQIVDINTLMFVVLHEVAHIANYAEWNHKPQFWSIFKFLLNEAVVSGIYKPVDYARNPVDYCGFNINHNPIFDDRITAINNIQRV
jgi:hypothetical protein